jgi:hypothetical protein
MTRRTPPKGRGADIFLGEGGSGGATPRPRPKGRGADVFLGAEPEVGRPRRRPQLRGSGTPAPDRLAAGLDELARNWDPAARELDRSQVAVMLWLRLALQGEVGG